MGQRALVCGDHVHLRGPPPNTEFTPPCDHYERLIRSRWMAAIIDYRPTLRLFSPRRTDHFIRDTTRCMGDPSLFEEDVRSPQRTHRAGRSHSVHHRASSNGAWHHYSYSVGRGRCGAWCYWYGGFTIG